MGSHSRYFRGLLLGSIIGLLLVSVLSLCLGNVNFRIGDIWNILTGKGDSVYAGIFWYSRVPRTLACGLAGTALAVSGAVLQNVLANKLASPSIIGVNAGAGLGVTLACALGILSGWKVSLAAFAGSLLTVTAISLLASRMNASKTTVILSGVALNSILNALCESITVLDMDVAALSMDFRVGGFAAVSYTRLLPAAVMILISLAVLLTLCNELDVVTLGDETAQGVGLPVRKYRGIFLILAALLAGAAVSFAGLLGFVGLIVPHFVRRIIGNESRKLIPLSAFMGACFVIFCDWIARMIFAPFELPVGILMSVIGGPVFVLLLIHRKGDHRND